MEAKVKFATRNVVEGMCCLKTNLQNNNPRLVNKYITVLRVSQEKLIEAIVLAETEGMSLEEACIKEANQVSVSSRDLLMEGEDFVLEHEENEEAKTKQKVAGLKLKEFYSSINSFREWLKDNQDVSRGTEKMEKFRKEKVSLACELDEESEKQLETLFRSVDAEFEQWMKKISKLSVTTKVVEGKPSERRPGLKLDRLSVPTFSGNIRAYAKFKREFNNTVALEFPDPQVKLLYLQNQCIQGAAKDCIKNLTDFDSAMERLDDKYGRPRFVIDDIIRDLSRRKLPEDESAKVIALHKVLEEAWDDITAINATDEFCNVVTLGVIEAKIPSRLQLVWAQEKQHDASSKKLMVALKDFIDQHKRIAEEALAMRVSVLDIYGPRQSRNTDLRNVNAVDVPSEQMTVNALEGINQRKGCFRCGWTNHRIKDCRVPSHIVCRRCSKAGHIENACREAAASSQMIMKPKDERERDAGTNQEGYTSNHVDFDTRSAVRLPIETLMTNYGPCLTLWDSGSMINLVSKQWANDNGLTGKKCNLEYKIVDSESRKFITNIYEIQLISRSGLRKTINAYELETLAASISELSHEVVAEVVESLNIQLESISNASGNIQLLLGGELMIHFPIVKHQVSELCVMSSDFGLSEYFIVGSQRSCWRSTGVNVICNVVDKFLTDFFSVEEIGVRPPPICKTCKSCEICKPAAQFMSLKEHMELNVIKSKLTYDSDKQVWTAAYPYNKDPTVLNDNYQSAFKVLKRRENKLLKDETLLNLYSGQVSDFVERGVLKKMTDEELQGWTGPVRYMDHHEVFKENSTTPVRIVINSSFKEGNELSLNDILMKGPNVLSRLFDILIRWRLYPVAFTGDISKMYHNVRTGQMEANLRRLLWRDCEQNRPPDIYCFQTVTFGDRPAGCIVVSALRATADMFTSISEDAASVIKKDSYMDDVISGEYEIGPAKHLVSNIERIAEKGGFKFKKFVFSGEFQETGEKLPTEKVLGVSWEPSEDTIRVKVDLNHKKRKRGLRTGPVELDEIPFTRRICLRLVNGIFDPLGFASPVIVKLKILMKQQFVLQDKYKKWDTLLAKEDKLEWIKVLRQLQELNQIQVPRFCIHGLSSVVGRTGKYSLICFSDASGNAMCAAVYVRFESESGEIGVGLLVSKTRVSPAKTETIPKLELCASLLGARLVRKVTSAISITFEAEYFLIDSKIVLGALSKGSLANDFSGSCIAEIRGKTKSATFGWVQSEDNVADMGSRGAHPEKVRDDTDWHKGPSWLYEPVNTWPVEFVALEELPVVGSIEVFESVINIEKYTDIEKLHKLTALCLKFLRSKGNGKKKVDCDWKKIKLTPEDYRNAELYWIKKVSESVITLYNAQKLQSLRPSQVWDENGQFLKVVTSGRLGTLLKIGYDIEELTILDPAHPYTKLVMKECHDIDHGSDDKAVWKSRNKFWIPSARKIVRKIRKDCYRCRLLNKKNAQQLMAPLPNTRVLPTPAWTFTSLDLFGPLEHADMVRKRLKEKCWGVLFTCRVSRAVHLDLTQGYDTDSLLQAIRRFMSLRGAPKEFLADQGSQMIACSKEIAGVLELIDWSVVEGWCTKRTIAWKFVPPQAQHMNGVTESLIRSTKHILKTTLDGKRLTYAETQTVLYEAAQVMNCRPLGNFSRPGSDPLDGGPITPNHLLLGRATTCIPEQKFTNVSNTKRIKFLQTCVQEFWSKWKTVVFHSLVPQYKWHRTQRNLQVKDIVLVNADSGMIGEYKMGQVHSIKTGKDGLVRSAQVRCVSTKDGKISKTYLDRPIHKLCIIVPVEEQ